MKNALLTIATCLSLHAISQTSLNSCGSDSNGISFSSGQFVDTHWESQNTGLKVVEGVHLTVTLQFLGISDYEIADIKIYPNPTMNKISVETDINSIISIYDYTGKQILTKKIDSFNTEIDLSSYPAGSYNITIQNNIFKTIKIVKL